MSARQPFFVTGLPRSRTAWLANWLTTDTTICFQDTPFALDKVQLDRLTGFAGPELLLQAGEVLKVFPEAPWLAVLRQTDDARAAFVRAAGTSLKGMELTVERAWGVRRDALARLCGHPLTLAVPFEDLDVEPTAREAWAHLLQGVPFDADRWNVLTRFNVQQKLPRSWQF